jgi:hypothetical protein
MLVGRPLAGISIARARMQRGPGVLLLAMGTFGWAYYATDSGAILEARTAHVGFGGLFSLCWIALGLVLLKREDFYRAGATWRHELTRAEYEIYATWQMRGPLATHYYGLLKGLITLDSEG